MKHHFWWSNTVCFLVFVWWCTSQRSVLGQYFHIRGFPKMGYPGYPNSWMAYHGTSETNMDENWGTQISIYYSVPMCSPSLGAVVLNLLVLLEVIAIPQIPWWSCRFYSINGHRISYLFDNPICSMYGIFTYIWVIFRVNVGKYSIHGAYENIWTCLSDMICCTACIFQLQLFLGILGCLPVRELISIVFNCWFTQCLSCSMLVHETPVK